MSTSGVVEFRPFTPELADLLREHDVPRIADDDLEPRGKHLVDPDGNEWEAIFSFAEVTAPGIATAYTVRHDDVGPYVLYLRSVPQPRRQQ